MKLKRDCETCTKRHPACQDTCEVMQYNKQIYETIRRERSKYRNGIYAEHKQDVINKTMKRYRRKK